MADNNNLELIHNALKNLQSVLKDRFELEEEIESLPQDLKIKQNALNSANAKYLELTENFNKAKNDYSTNSIKYDEAKTYREESEKKMDEISTQREYEALSKQIDDAKIKEQSLLKARTVSQAQVKELEEQLADQQAVCDSLTEEVRCESEKIEVTISEKQKLIDELDAKSLELREDIITDDLYKKFAMIVQNKKGVGIVPIHGQVCQGCHMILPVQFVNDVRANLNIEYCPYCSRILFYEDSENVLDVESLVSELEDDEDALTDVVDSSDFDDIL